MLDGIQAHGDADIFIQGDLVSRGNNLKFRKLWNRLARFVVI